jgi:uncharacterized coiled-coil protein SlyX
MTTDMSFIDSLTVDELRQALRERVQLIHQLRSHRDALLDQLVESRANKMQSSASDVETSQPHLRRVEGDPSVVVQLTIVASMCELSPDYSSNDYQLEVKLVGAGVDTGRYTYVIVTYADDSDRVQEIFVDGVARLPMSYGTFDKIRGILLVPYDNSLGNPVSGKRLATSKEEY